MWYFVFFRDKKRKKQQSVPSYIQQSLELWTETSAKANFLEFDGHYGIIIVNCEIYF